MSADTFLWNGGDFGSYSNAANWQVISTVDSTVVTNTATRVPGGNDSFADPQRIFADLDGQDWEIKNFNNNLSSPYWGRGIFNFTNGLLRVKNSATWHGTDGSANPTILFDGATLEMASTSTFTPGEGDGASHVLKVYPNATLNIFGTLRIYKFDLEVQAGGTANISPTYFKARGGSTQDSYLRNAGTMIFGDGISLSEGSWGNYKLDVIQNDGTMIFGGPVNKNGMGGTYTIEFKKGTVKTLADVSFAFDNQKIPDNSDLVFEVAENTTCDLSNFTLGSNVQISKSGAGTLITKLLNGKVSGGVVIPDECGNVEFAGGKVLLVASGDGFPVIPTASAPERMVLKLILGENCALTIGSAGLELTEDSVIDATAAISIDYLNIPANTTFIKCATAAQRTLLREKLAICLGSIGTVIETEDGVAWKMNAIFTGGSEHLTDLMADAGWADGMAAPAGGDVTITGGAAAVMSADVPNCGGMRP